MQSATRRGRDAGATWRRLITARRIAVAGAVWGIAGNAYVIARSVDETIPTFLHNPSARHDEIVHALAGFACFAVALAALLVSRVPNAARSMIGAVAAVAGVSFTAEAIVLSAQPNAAVGLAVLALPPFLVLAAGVVAMAVERERAMFAVVLAASIVVASVTLDVFVVRDPYREAVLFIGLRPNWYPETAVDNAVVDAAGNVWGMRPWAEASPSELSLRRDSRFVALEARAHGWPPTVVGVDASGATWIASSDLDDPFDPVIEVYRNGRLERVPSPDRRLPPLDAMAVDPEAHRFLALHSDFGIPAQIILEIYEDGRWRSQPTPVRVAGRAERIDLAVDPGGRVWMWHAAAPERVNVLDGSNWSDLRLGFDAAATDDLAHISVGLDPYQAFVSGPDGELWMFDAGGRRLVQPSPTGEQADAIPLPNGCRPKAVDAATRVWCAGDTGLRIVDDEGEVVYDSVEHGLPRVRVESLSIGSDDAWLLVARGDARQLLRFTHAAALD